MVKDKTQEIVKRLNEQISQMWLTTPDEVIKLRKTRGTLNQYLTTLLYMESEAREMVDYLHILRMTAKSNPESLEFLKSITRNILKFKAEKWPGHYHVHKTVGLLKECILALEEVNTTDDYVILVEALKQYINIWNWWMDIQIPYSELSILYNWITLGSDVTVPEDRVLPE